MADIFQEVDEELRQENYLKLWRKYGGVLIGVVVAIIVVTAVYVGWRDYRTAQRLEEGARFVEAVDLAASEQTEAALAALASLAQEADTGYATLASLRQAALLADGGDVAGAVAIYDRIAADADVDRGFRDLAVILSTLSTLETSAPDAMLARLGPLTSEGNPWRHTALELSALVAQRTGDAGRAREIYAGLADDAEAPPSLRSRATEMLATLGG